MQAQTEYCASRHQSLVWVLKLVRQGIFASFQAAIIKVLFGKDGFMRLMAPSSKEGRHQLAINAFPATGAQDAELEVVATVSFSVRDQTADMVPIGDIPFTLTVRTLIGEEGEMTGFQMRLVLPGYTIMG